MRSVGFEGKFVLTGFEGPAGRDSLVWEMGSETGIGRNGGKNWVCFVRISVSGVGGGWTVENVRLLLLPYDGLREAQG